MRKKKRRKFSRDLQIVILFLCAIILIALILFLPKSVNILFPLIPETSITGFEQVLPSAYVQGNSGVVVLSSRCYRVEGALIYG